MLPILDIHKNLPKKGKILDLGCGNGIISLMLAKYSAKRQLIGWDLDEQRVETAIKRSGASKNVTIKVGNAITDRIPEISGAVASDFLHHLPKNDQEAVIKKIYFSLKKNGILIIKEIDKDNFIRQKLSKFWDRLFYPNDKIYYRGHKEWAKLLEKTGFSVLSKDCVLWFPGSTKLFICKKR